MEARQLDGARVCRDDARGPEAAPEPEPEPQRGRGAVLHNATNRAESEPRAKGRQQQQAAPRPLFGQPLERLRRRRDAAGLPLAISRLARTLLARLQLPSPAIDPLPHHGAAPDAVVARLVAQLEARDNADLSGASIVQLFGVLERWLSALPAPVVSGPLVPEYVGVWQQHGDRSAAVLAARTLSAERAALLHLVLGVVRRLSDADTQNWASLPPGWANCPFVATVAPSLIGPAQLGASDATRLVALWLSSAAQLAVEPESSTSEDDAPDETNSAPIFAVTLNFFLDDFGSASTGLRCGRLAVCQGVTQLGSAWARAQMGGQSCGMDKRQYQLLTNLETGFITLKVLADDPPTRLRRAASQLGVVLPKGMVQELSDGDTLSLPGARFVFEVRRRKKVDEDEDHPAPMETVPPLSPLLVPHPSPAIQ